MPAEKDKSKTHKLSLKGKKIQLGSFLGAGSLTKG